MKGEKPKLRWVKEFKPNLVPEIPKRMWMVVHSRLHYLTGSRNDQDFLIPGANWGFIGPFVWHTVTSIPKKVL